MSKRKNKKSNNFISIMLILIIFIGIIVLISNAYMSDKAKNQINQNKEKTKETKKNDSVNKKENNISSSSNTNNIMNTNDAVSEPAKTEKDENKQENANNITVKIELIGEEEVIISKGEKYNDLGAKAVDSTGKDVSDKIKVDNTVNTNKEGTYTVTYSIGNSIVMRYVIVK